jgi:DNA repair exonuclease SbcCD nuclease subunit
MLFAHIADTHLGYRQFNLEERERDFYFAFQESVDKMIAEGVDCLIHAGDLFDEPRPSIRALVEAKSGIRRLREKGIKIVMIPGNHDKLMRKGTMLPHAIFDDVELISKENPFVVIGDVFIGGVPYISKSYRDQLLEEVAALEEIARDHKKSVLILHQGVDKYLSQEYELHLDELPKTFDYYALGHVHRRIEEEFNGSNICYSGSTEVWRSNEASDWESNGKGFLLVDSEDMKPRRMDLEGTRPFLTSEIRSEEDISQVATRAKDFEQPIVHLTISGEDFNSLDEAARVEFSKKALYLAIKRKVFVEENHRTIKGFLEVDSMISEALKDFNNEEKDFGLEAFRHLSKNEVEEALKLADDFYEKWKKGGERR